MIKIIRLSVALVAITVVIAMTAFRCSQTPRDDHQPHAAVSSRIVHKQPMIEASPAAPPAVEPVEYLPIDREEAIALNAKQISTDDVGPSARPFRIVTSSPDGMRALRCLTEAIYYEAASEADDGQRAVAQVVLNRVRNRAFPATICGVVYQGWERKTGCQFTFTCDGSLAREVGQRAWHRAEHLAKAALAGTVFEPVGNATHYHANWVVPYWAPSLARTTSIGAHIFYRWKGAWGKPQAFTQSYIGFEPAPWLTADQPQPANSSRSTNIFDRDALDGGRLPKPVLLDGARATLTPAAERALSGGTLLIDEKPPRLIPSLARKPQLTFHSPTGAARQHQP